MLQQKLEHSPNKTTQTSVEPAHGSELQSDTPIISQPSEELTCAESFDDQPVDLHKQPKATLIKDRRVTIDPGTPASDCAPGDALVKQQ